MDLDQYMHLCGIYRIRNLTNDKFYIGSSQDVIRRLRQHKRALLKDNHKNPKLQASWNKHGPPYFEFEFLFSSSIEDLLYWEQFTINHLAPQYNVCAIAGNTKGRPLPQSAKDKLRNLNLGKKYSEETKLKHSIQGKQMWINKKRGSPEWILRMQQAANKARHKPVDCICLNTGLVIKTYPSLVATSMNQYQPANISAVCRGIRNQAHGYGWAWA